MRLVDSEEGVLAEAWGCRETTLGQRLCIELHRQTRRHLEDEQRVQLLPAVGPTLFVVQGRSCLVILLSETRHWTTTRPVVHPMSAGLVLPLSFGRRSEASSVHALPVSFVA